jgi:hypothetical protein
MRPIVLDSKDICGLVIAQLPTGELINVDKETEESTLIGKLVDVRFLNLFQSAPIMYQTLDYQLKMLDHILAELRIQNQVNAILPFEIMRDSIVSTMDAAVRGISNVVKEFESKKNFQ